MQGESGKKERGEAFEKEEEKEKERKDEGRIED